MVTKTDSSGSPGQLSPGTRFGPYVIRALVGAGGMGEVYRAHDPRLARDVAVKVLPTAGQDPDRVQRFEVEARATAALSHPNILAIFDVGSHEGTPYLVTELLQGESLRDRIAWGTVTVREAVEMVIQAARALAAAHDHGIVHRDLKPGNLFITNDGHLKILDFGLARLAPAANPDSTSQRPTATAGTETGTVLGTVGYMAPEQVRGEVADARADIFALGVVLFELLAGKPPFARGNKAETLSAVLRDDPPSLISTPGGASPALSRIVERCLAKRPEERFQSAHDLALSLEAVTSTSAADVALDEPRPSRRHAVRKAVVAATVALLVVAGALALRFFQTGDTPENTTPGAAAEPARRPPQNRVAILPFVNKTGDPEQDALGYTMAAGVWSAVANVPDVDAVPMAAVDSALATDGGTKSTVVANVNAGVVVSGTILAEGSDFRVQAVVQDMLSSHLRPPAEEMCPSAERSRCVERLAVRVAEIVELQVHEPELLLMLNRLPSYEAYRAIAVDNDEERGFALDPAITILRRLNRAYRRFDSGEWAEAAAAAHALLDDHSNLLSEYGTRCSRGAVALFELNTLSSLQDLRKASELEPSSLLARVRVAKVALVANRPLEAAAVYADVAPCENYMGWNLIHALHQAGDFEGAVAAARSFLACFPDWILVNNLEVVALAALGRVDEMETALESRLTRPGWGASFAGLTNAAQVMNEASLELLFRGDQAAFRSLAERALASYQRALETLRSRESTEPSVEQEARLANLLWQAGRETEADELCRNLLERSPEHLTVVSMWGVFAARRGDRPEAEKAEAILADSGGTLNERLQASYNRTCITAQLGDTERAIDLFRETVSLGWYSWDAIRRDPDLEPLRTHPTFKEIVRPKG